ncbi:hypothetical protein [Dysosmobacter sp.]|uniref:hypothetical protein n=1 Tax=Dysosmobacter sp. TaxID=2591382 RepID=UPI002A95B9D0|nr:hypothetical protein [Dysosmobacter sp.]MCI6054990.1 hypothetical protein [Dysosmobacter sp.]MDY5509226.1 hypothetical protein [Dysosmobacter sp.]
MNCCFDLLTLALGAVALAILVSVLLWASSVLAPLAVGLGICLTAALALLAPLLLAAALVCLWRRHRDRR